MTDAELARDIAEETGALLRAIRREDRETGAALGARADREANALILSRLRAERPGEFVLSEESEDDPARCAARRVWIVDPLDGTREYVEGRDDWAVHVGLAIDGVAAIGAVAVPDRYGTLSSAMVRPPGVPAGDRPRIVVSRTRPPAIAERVAAALDADLAPMGSAGVKAMAVVRGEADIYLHAGGQYQWDNCAPVAIARAAGLSACRLDGRELAYNCAELAVPDLLICGRSARAHLLAVIASALDEIERNAPSRRGMAADSAVSE